MLTPPDTLCCWPGMRCVMLVYARPTAEPMAWTPGTSRAAIPAIFSTTWSAMVVSPYAVCRASSGLDSGPALAASWAFLSSAAVGVVMLLIQTPQDWGSTGRNAVHKSGGHHQTNRHR